MTEVLLGDADTRGHVARTTVERSEDVRRPQLQTDERVLVEREAPRRHGPGPRTARLPPRRPGRDEHDEHGEDELQRVEWGPHEPRSSTLLRRLREHRSRRRPRRFHSSRHASAFSRCQPASAVGVEDSGRPSRSPARRGPRRARGSCSERNWFGGRVKSSLLRAGPEPSGGRGAPSRPEARLGPCARRDVTCHFGETPLRVSACAPWREEARGRFRRGAPKPQ